MSFRWFGDSDPVSLSYIRQIPGMQASFLPFMTCRWARSGRWNSFSHQGEGVFAIKAKVKAHGFALRAC
jgi:D-mannonate dehydratase